MNDIQDTINRISSRFQQMQKYEAHQDKLEASTLVAFAEWTVSPNAHSVHHLMERLHLILLGPEEKENTTMNVLSLLAKTYEVRISDCSQYTYICTNINIFLTFVFHFSPI